MENLGSKAIARNELVLLDPNSLLPVETTVAPAAKGEAVERGITPEQITDAVQDEEIHTGFDGSPSLKKGRNNRDKMAAWVMWQSKQMLRQNDTLPDLIGRIKLEAERCGYESERKPLTNEIIRKMLPSKITGGRTKNRGTSKK